MHRFPALFAALALAGLAATPVSSAVIQTVILADLPDFDPTDGICDADEANDLVVDPDPLDDEVVPVGQCTLRAAIQTANFEPGPDTIRLRATRYVLSVGGPAEDAALTGDLDITSDITIDGQNYQLSLIDGKKLKDRIFDVHPGGSLTMNQTGLLFGKAPKPELDSGVAGEMGSGGCLRSWGPLTLDQVFFFRCAASAGGGCMSVRDDTATVTDSVFARCRARTEGGGVEVAALGAATFSRMTAGACRAATGGGIATRGTVTLSNAVFTLNSAKLGDGVALLGDGTTTIRHATIADNRRTNLLSQTTGSATISSSIVSGAKTDCSGPVTSAGGNLESGTSCAFTGTNDQQNEDPLVQPLAFFGAIPTAAIAEGSPAIDHGVDDACLDPGDAREALRVVTNVAGVAIADSGAFEFGSETFDNLGITSVPVTSATVGNAYSYDVAATNPGREVCTLEFELDTAPTGMTIDSASGLISWTPVAGQEGSNLVTARVTDTGGLSETQSFSITVAPAP